MKIKTKTTFFIGAGFTFDLGFPMTGTQDELIGAYFFDKSEDEFRKEKCCEKLHLQEEEIRTLYALKNSDKNNPDYNIPGLCSYVKHFFTKESFKMMSMYNLIDMQISMGQSYTLTENGKQKIIRTEEIVRYRRGMLVLLQAILSLSTKKALKSDKLNRYVSFFKNIARETLRDKRNQLYKNVDPTTEEFIFSNISYITTNWDAIFLWAMFQAHKQLNDENAGIVCYNGKNLKLKIFNDFATFMSAKYIGKGKENEKKLWFPYNESVAVHINDKDHLHDKCVTLMKTFLPHGQTNWLECPVCGSLNMYLGDTWDLRSDSIVMKVPKPGDADTVYKCLHCEYDHLTTADSSMLLQTLIKKKSSYIEEIQRDMRLQIQKSDRLIFIGYSLPDDDFEYKSIFASKSDEDHKKEVYVVLHDDACSDNRWLTADEANKFKKNQETIKHYTDLFGKEHVHINLQGFPNADQKIVELLKDDN